MSEAENEIAVYSGTVKPGNGFNDLTGKQFFRLKVVSRAPGRPKANGKFQAMWNCVCECGKSSTVAAGDLRNGHTKSCGCHRTETTVARSTIHGCCSRNGKTPEFGVWVSMRQRCLDPNTKSYLRYGGRGITICERWLDSFVNFLADMGPRPSPEHSIDRKNNAGNYEPDNCVWATRKAQARNKRNTHIIELDGQRKSMVEWAEIAGMDVRTLWNRINLGWTPKRAISEPLRKWPSQVTTKPQEPPRSAPAFPQQAPAPD